MYNSQYQYTHDIDWFFMNGTMPVHVASNGGLLPNNIYKAIVLQNLQTKVEAMHPDFGFQLNMNAIEHYVFRNYANMNEEEFKDIEVPEYIKQIEFPEKTPVWIKIYSWSFAKMAQRGFYSFDRDPHSGLYFLVAKPNKETNMSEDILNLMFQLPMEHALVVNDCNFSQVKQHKLVSHINKYVSLRQDERENGFIQ